MIGSRHYRLPPYALLATLDRPLHRTHLVLSLADHMREDFRRITEDTLTN